MDISLKYKVHSCVEDDFAVAATVGGREVEAKISGLVVELVSDDESMGHTFKFIPDNFEIKDALTDGAEVTVTLSVAAQASAEASTTPPVEDTAAPESQAPLDLSTEAPAEEAPAEASTASSPVTEGN